MSATYEGIILTEIQTGEAKSGNKYHKFSLREKSKKQELINCTIWESNCTGRYANLRTDSKIIVTGFYGKSQKTMEGFEVLAEEKQFIVTSFRFPEEVEGSRANEIRDYGGEEGYRKHLEEFDKAKREKGYVRVPNPSRYVRLDDAVQVDGKWIYWGDFVYEQCPSGKRNQLTDGFRKFARGFGLLRTGDKRTAGADNYSTWKQQLIKRAKDIFEEKCGKVLLPAEKTWEQKVAEANLV